MFIITTGVCVRMFINEYATAAASISILNASFIIYIRVCQPVFVARGTNAGVAFN